MQIKRPCLALMYSLHISVSETSKVTCFSNLGLLEDIYESWQGKPLQKYLRGTMCKTK